MFGPATKRLIELRDDRPAAAQRDFPTAGLTTGL
jgi:hypothetical protein